MSNRQQTKLTILIIIMPLEDAVKFLGVGENLLTTKLEPFTFNDETFVQLTI